MPTPTLPDIEHLARHAGEILRAGYNKEHQVSFKGVIDLVTEVDRASEEYLLGAIKKQWPGSYIISEESGVTPGNPEHTWYVDPLDGTVNYAHGVPIFSVSISYAHGGVMQLAAVYDPMLDEMFSAERGQGARMNGQPIHASQVSELERSLLVTGFPYDTWDTKQDNFGNFTRLAKMTQGVRRFGSAALDAAYVGAGRFDGFWELSLKPWDIAAGGLIAEEGGARVTNVNNQRDYISAPQSIVAAAPGLHAKILEHLVVA